MAQRVLSVTVLLLLASSPLFASPTRNNDDSCDISVLPAATLLLPYFEVSAAGDVTTLFTVINAGAAEQIAHITLWTDYGYPVIDFNVYLTGYDAQSINLHDVIWRGVIAPEIGTGPDIAYQGDFSIENPALDLDYCESLPGAIPAVYMTRMQTAFTLGRVNTFGPATACNTVGTQHLNAVGYATIDVVRVCSIRTPWDPEYFTQELLWENILLGDYQQIDRRPVKVGQNRPYAEGSAMVHIRAVPEGGTSAERLSHPEQYPVTFHRTFYSRYLPDSNKTLDGRQPLPALFAAHWIGGANPDLKTSYKIWREGNLGPTTCSMNALNDIQVAEVITFDEDENPRIAPRDVIGPPPPPSTTHLPLTKLLDFADTSVIPPPTSGAVSGWTYLNLDSNADDDYANQAWVIIAMRSASGLSVDQEAIALGNGCTPPRGLSQIDDPAGIAIGPSSNINP
jgi:hypothetical protein